MPFGVTAGPVLRPDRVTLGVHEEALLARKRTFDRPLHQPGCQSGVGLVGHVLLSAKRPSVGDQLDGHSVALDTEASGDLVAVVPDALPPRIDVQTTVGAGHG